MNQTTNAQSSSLGQTEGFSAYLSVALNVEPGGKAATPVNAPPNGTFIFALAFTAQPLASRIGPRLRLRNFNQAMAMDGAEITSKIPAMTNGTCHGSNPLRKPRRPANAAAKVPRAKLSRAITLGSNAGLAGVAGVAGAAAGAGTRGALATVVNCAFALASAAAACFAARSSIRRTSFL